MICEKCIHKDICEHYAYNGLRIPNMMQYGGDKCVAFKDKTMFIELPCEVIPHKKITVENEEPYLLKVETTYSWKVIRPCFTLKEARRVTDRIREEYKKLYGVEMEDKE